MIALFSAKEKVSLSPNAHSFQVIVPITDWRLLIESVFSSLYYLLSAKTD